MASDEELSEGWVLTDEENEQEPLEDQELDLSIQELPAKRIKQEKQDVPEYHNPVATAHHSKTWKSFSTNSSSSALSLNACTFDNYLSKNPKLVNVPKIEEVEITSDDEIWTMQCPSNFNISKLVGLPIFSSEKRKIRIPDSTYECVSLEKNSNSKIAILSPGDKNLINFHNTNGRFVIREKMSKAFSAEIVDKPHVNVPFPSNLKVRHPLFGIDYKQHVDLPNSVKEKLENIGKKKLKIKKEKIDIKTEDDEESYAVVDKKDKSSKKRKMNESCDATESYNPNKKIKKEKNVWETETSIAKCLFDVPTKRKKM